MKPIRERERRKLDAAQIVEGWFDDSYTDVDVPDGVLLDPHKRETHFRDMPGGTPGKLGQWIVLDHGRLHLMEDEKFQEYFEDDPDPRPVPECEHPEERLKHISDKAGMLCQDCDANLSYDWIAQRVADRESNGAEDSATA
jgi:hypothetical protein